jgi:hypothetical protein
MVEEYSPTSFDFWLRLVLTLRCWNFYYYVNS